MKHSWTFVTVMMFCWCTLAFAGDGSPEETAVRAAYDKTSKSIDAGIAYAKTHDQPAAQKSDPVAFELSKFQTGALSAISGVEYRWLVTEPKGEEVFGIGFVTSAAPVQYAEAGSWRPGQTLIEDWAIPMSQMLRMTATQNGAAVFTRYAAFTVKVTHQGKSRTYQALCLFGADDGKPVAKLIDTVTGLNGDAVQYFLNHPDTPPL